jgi:hypothetical protein
MIFPELREIRSVDLDPPALPPDPQHCAVRFHVVIGPRGGAEREAFAFTVVTPGYLAGLEAPRWGRGHLLLPVFEWEAIKQALARLLALCARPTWEDVAAELSRELQWQPGSPDAAGS